MSLTDTEIERVPVVLPEAAEIQATRELLMAVLKRVEDDFSSSEPDAGWMARRRAINIGRLIQTLDVAEHALYEVLVAASVYGKCFAAGHVLDGAHGKLTPEERANGDALIAASIGLIDGRGQLHSVRS